MVSRTFIQRIIEFFGVFFSWIPFDFNQNMQKNAVKVINYFNY